MTTKPISLQEGWEMMPTGGIVRTGGLQLGSLQQSSITLTPADQVPPPPQWGTTNTDSSSNTREDGR